MHLNAGYTVLGSPQGQERPGAYRAVAAVSYPLGYRTASAIRSSPASTPGSGCARTAEPHRCEIGIRHQLTSRLVVDGGLGTEFLWASDRAVLLGTMGLSVGFSEGYTGL